MTASTESTDPLAALATIHTRLERVEDELAILRLLAQYFPLVDAGASEVSELWHTDGIYDVDTASYDSRAAIAAMVDGPEHQGLIQRGAGHVPGLPFIELAADGRSAVATQHTQLVVTGRGAGRFHVVRVTANRWELDKTAGQWRVRKRTARVLGGDGTGRKLLSQARHPNQTSYLTNVESPQTGGPHTVEAEPDER